jgi:hypothetical protein
MSISRMDETKLFPHRKSRIIFIARVVALLLMSGAVAAYGLKQLAPAPAAATASTSPRRANSSESGEFSIQVDAAGLLTENALVTSDDGLASLRIPKGTKALDAGGQPLTRVTVTTTEIPLRNEIGLIGLGYTFGPEGATLNPPVRLTLTFDPTAYYPFTYQDIDCNHLHMAYYTDNQSGPPWRVPWLVVDLDAQTHSATTRIDHLSTMILFCEVFNVPVSHNLDRWSTLRIPWSNSSRPINCRGTESRGNSHSARERRANAFAVRFVETFRRNVSTHQAKE